MQISSRFTIALHIFSCVDEHDVLNEDGIIIVEVRKDTVLQEQYGSMSLYKDKKYGINRLLYYRKDMKE